VPFDWSQYELLAQMMGALKGKAIVTLNDHPDVRACFAGFDIEAVGIDYTVGGQHKAVKRQELIIYSWQR
jgi:DNA adenine methylase